MNGAALMNHPPTNRLTTFRLAPNIPPVFEPLCQFTAATLVPLSFYHYHNAFPYRFTLATLLPGIGLLLRYFFPFILSLGNSRPARLQGELLAHLFFIPRMYHDVLLWLSSEMRIFCHVSARNICMDPCKS
jgi:hypothetical protein